MCEGISRHRGHVETQTRETILRGWHHPIGWKSDATEVKRKPASARASPDTHAQHHGALPKAI